MRSLW